MYLLFNSMMFNATYNVIKCCQMYFALIKKLNHVIIKPVLFQFTHQQSSFSKMLNVLHTDDMINSVFLANVVFVLNTDIEGSIFHNKDLYLGDNCIQIFHLGWYIVGYTVGNFVLRRRVSGAVKHDF